MDQVKLDTVFVIDDFGKALSNSFVSISSPCWKCFSLIVCQSLLKFLTLTTVLNIIYCILKLSHTSLCGCFLLSGNFTDMF